MSGLDFRKLMDLVGDALEQPEDQREAWLRQKCDGQMLEEALSLIREAPSREHLTNILEERVANSARDLEPAPIADPERIGNFRILERIGAGGMGVVYRALDEGSLQREVAIKLIRGNLSNESLVLRFEAERRLLARMDHPNIATVHLADSDEHGRPFVVMELVRGKPLVEACDAAQLGMKQRMDLFIRVCDAVQHAHQRGVIHRDLKPTNILVSEVDGRLVPKVIDFGIAKMLDSTGTDSPMTSEGLLVGTLEYMSPEQSRSATVDLDVRSDIYSLVVLLYQLSTGMPPFGERKLRAGGLTTALETIQNEVPPLASARLARAVAEGEASEAATARDCTPRRLARFLKGDLDWIIARALEKDPDRRYQSASEFRNDLVRFLRDEPVEAGPPSKVYRFRRLVRRNRVAVVASLVVLVALVAGTVVANVGLLRAIEARKVAESETANARAVSDFLSDMLTSAKPENARGEDVTIMQALESATRKLEDEDLSETPVVEASIHFAIGDSYQALGDYAGALVHLERAYELYAAELPDTDERIFQALDRIGMVHWLSGDLDSSLEISQQLLEMRRRTVGENHPKYADALGNVGNTYADMGDLQQAERYLRRVLEIDRAQYEVEPGPYLCYSLNNLATILADQEKYEEAIALHSQSITLRREHFGDPSPAVAISLTNLGFAQRGAGQFEDARGTLEAAVAMSTTVFGPDHLRTSIAQTNLASVLLDLDRPREALPRAEAALSAARASIGDDGWRVARVQVVLARIHFALGDLDGAATGAASAYRQFSADLGAGSDPARETATLLAEIAGKGQDEAERARWSALAEAPGP